ncbi:MAG: 23S rRNA (guanosine(2251)-2'-O)-methyltransferase RlmB [Clostridia bacterium]|nr:23S rRNA (guanosine(2251)-2'-O)-methyltransferase RlmB [Clostridia bacterium]
MENSTIEGRNPVFEALVGDLPIEKIYISETAHGSQISKIINEAKRRGIQFKSVSADRLDEISETQNNQGVVAVVSTVSYCSVDDIFAFADEKCEKPFIIICDEITDPHNLGAIIRTANAVGAHGVIIPKNRAVGVNAVVYKTSAGAAAHMRIAKVGNLSQTINELKSRGVWITGADMTGNVMYDEDLKGSIAVVVGSEGKGISKKIKENCDFLVKVPMVGQINSLNASVAASVIMYEVLRQRREA